MTRTFIRHPLLGNIWHNERPYRTPADVHSKLPAELILHVASYLQAEELCHYAGIDRRNWLVLKKSCHEMALKVAEPTYEEFQLFLNMSPKMQPKLPCEVENSDICDRTKFSVAVCRGYLQAVESFLAHGVSANAYNIQGKRVLTLAGECDAPLQMSHLLLHYGANPCLTDVLSDYCCLLFAAATMAQDELVKLLIDYGADVKRESVIHTLCQICRRDTVKYAIIHGANVHEISESGRNILHSAAENEDPEVLCLLLNMNLSLLIVHERTRSGKTPLMRAVKHNRPHNVATLLRHGANVHSTLNTVTALHVACSRGFVEVASWLIQGGANVNAADLNGNRPLHSALSMPSIEMVRLLVQKGADVAATDNAGNTPLHLLYSKINDPHWRYDTLLEVAKVLRQR